MQLNVFTTILVRAALPSETAKLHCWLRETFEWGTLLGAESDTNNKDLRVLALSKTWQSQVASEWSHFLSEQLSASVWPLDSNSLAHITSSLSSDFNKQGFCHAGRFLNSIFRAKKKTKTKFMSWQILNRVVECMLLHSSFPKQKRRESRTIICEKCEAQALVKVLQKEVKL